MPSLLIKNCDWIVTQENLVLQRALARAMLCGAAELRGKSPQILVSESPCDGKLSVFEH
jgi:hypothetical protein